MTHHRLQAALAYVGCMENNMSNKTEEQLGSGSGGVAGGGRSFKDLPDDIMRTILLRLPRDALRRFAAVSKNCRRLVSDPVFLSSYNALQPRMLGFYMNGLFSSGCVFVPTASTPWLLHYEDMMRVENIVAKLKTVIPELKNDLMNSELRFHMINAVAGILLFSISNPMNHEDDHAVVADEDYCNTTFAVYNPVTEQGFFIPRLPSSIEDDDHVGIICSDPCTMNPPRFNMVRVRVTSMTADVFDPVLRRWEERRLSSRSSANEVAVYKRNNIHPHVAGLVVDGSLLFWLHSDTHVLCYDHRRSHLSLIRLPLDLEHNTSYGMMESEGQLFFAVVGEGGVGLRMWVLQKDKMNWNLETNLISLPKELFDPSPTRRICPPIRIHPLRLDPTDRSVLFVWRNVGDIVSVNLRSNEVKLVPSTVPLYWAMEMFPYVSTLP